MSKIEAARPSVGFRLRRARPDSMRDPRITHKVLGNPVTFGDEITPDPSNFPGWKLTPFAFRDNSQSDGCVFTVEPGATPLGLVGNPTGESTQTPKFKEFVVAGRGELLLANNNLIVSFPVSPSRRQIVSYGPGARVAYFAKGHDELVGVNIGTPPGIPEDTLQDGDPRASEELWSIYHKLRDQK